MTTITLVRRDAVDANYAKPAYTMGCEVNPIPFGCLSCSLPTCKYDNPRTGHEVLIERGKATKARVIELVNQGLTVAEISERLGVSTRTAHRYKAEAAR